MHKSDSVFERKQATQMATILQKQINLTQQDSHTYHASFHPDWSVGPSMWSYPTTTRPAEALIKTGVHGGMLAAILQLAATKHFTTTLSAQNQPDILSMHIDFLRTCTHNPFTITITDLKIGRGTSTIQLHLTQPTSKPNANASQPSPLKISATVTSTNFSASPNSGPSAPTAWHLHPPPLPPPHFPNIATHRPDPHWLATTARSELMPLINRMTMLTPKGGFPVPGLCDNWNSFTPEPIEATHLTILTDLIPSMSDTLLRTGGVFDAHAINDAAATWDASNPGVPFTMRNSVVGAQRVGIWNATVTLDVEYQGRLGGREREIEWAFTRAMTRELRGGRMDVEATICDEDGGVLCVARQVVLVLDVGRTFDRGRKGGGGKSVL
ncbi:hypothetical protein OHC33_001841 [Knufia fluminis]|uniref:Thioesterase family protein n=1 Tax=Knufia fluminis TaxID=191047 RepID=A0AAN8EZU7_9EURO|nr:hypothetical protein OHC33_001841 [Knufia fluminis]